MSEELERGGKAGDGNKSAAAFEAALGLNPRRFVDDALDTVYDINQDAFQFARQEAATAGVLGAAKAAQKSAELDRGFNAIHHLVSDTLDQRMSSWERYCNGIIFTLPEGFVPPEDSNSCAKDPQRDGISVPDLDLELDLARKNLEDAIKESEDLRKELSLLERQATMKRELDFTVAEIQKLLEKKPVQQAFEDVAKVVPILKQKIISLNRTHTDTEAKSLVELPRENNLALYKDFTERREGIRESINILENSSRKKLS